MKIFVNLNIFFKFNKKQSTTRQQRYPTPMMKMIVTFLTFLTLISLTDLSQQNPTRWQRMLRGNNGKSRVVVVHTSAAPRHIALALDTDNIKSKHVQIENGKFGMSTTAAVAEEKPIEKVEDNNKKVEKVPGSPSIPKQQPPWFKKHLERTAKEDDIKTKQQTKLLGDLIATSVQDVGKNLEAQLKTFNFDFDKFKLRTTKQFDEISEKQNLIQISVEENKKQISEVAEKTNGSIKDLAERINKIETGGPPRPFTEFTAGWVGPDKPDSERPSTSQHPMALYHTSFRGIDSNLIQDWEDDFQLATCTCGLTPFRQRDWDGAKRVLEEGGEPVSDGAIRSLAVREYMHDCCGMKLEDIIKLGEKLESTFLMKNEKASKLAGEQIWDLYCRFKDTSGRFTLWGYAAALSALSRKVNGNKQPGQNGYLAFRVLILPPPQMEARFRKLKFLEWHLRNTKKAKGQEVATRIWFSRNDVVMEVKKKDAPPAEYRIVDERKEFPNENIPGIEFNCRTYREYKSPSKRYIRDAGKTPPGRHAERNEPDDAAVEFESETEQMEEDEDDADLINVGASGSGERHRSASYAGATPAKVPPKEPKEKEKGKKKSKEKGDKEKKKSPAKTLSRKRKQDNEAAVSMSLQIIMAKEKQVKFQKTDRYKAMTKKDQRAYDAKVEDEIALKARSAAKKVVRRTEDVAGLSSNPTTSSSETSDTE